MLLSQILDAQGNCAVVVRNGSEAGVLKGVSSTYQLVMDAIRRGQSLTERIRSPRTGPGRGPGASWPRTAACCCRFTIRIRRTCI